MKIICEREKLLSAFQIIAVLNLSNILVATDAEGCVIMGGSEIADIRINIPGVTVKTAGSVVLPVRKFGDILRESTEEKLSIKVDRGSVVVRSGQSEFKFPAQNPRQCDIVDPANEDQFHKVESRLLQEIIRRTLYATDTEDNRYALGGILLEFEDNKIIAVGTDGRRLVTTEVTAEAVQGHDGGECTVIIPMRAMQLVGRAFPDNDTEVQITCRDGLAILESPETTIYFSLSEGRFPKWRDVFPSEREATSIVLGVGEVLSAIRQAAIATNRCNRGLVFTFGGRKLVLTGEAGGVGKSRVELPIFYDGPQITTSLDYRYVIDFLKSLDHEQAFQMEIKDAESPIICSTEDEYQHVIMPLVKDR